MRAGGALAGMERIGRFPRLFVVHDDAMARADQGNQRGSRVGPTRGWSWSGSAGRAIRYRS